MSSGLTSTVHPINFAPLSGKDFERLAFALMLRMHSWKDIDWYGQSGDDGGRDIVGTRAAEWGRDHVVIVACANWRSFTSTKGKGDIDKFVDELETPPDEAILISGGPVSAKVKDTCRAHARSRDIRICKVWSGTEFEEFLRFHASSVVKRFFEGNKLPDDPSELRGMVAELAPTSSVEMVKMLRRIFDRPAFRDRIHEESSLPAFRHAIEDTIGALNTGIWRDRHGAIVARVLSREDFQSQTVRDDLGACVDSLMALRGAFDKGLRDEAIMPCQCDVPDCPTFMMDPATAQELSQLRTAALARVESAIAELESAGVESTNDV